MSSHRSASYIIAFSAAVCVVCSLLVSTAAVSLRDRQKANELLEKRRNVLSAAGLVKPGQSATADEVTSLFKNVRSVVIDLATGDPVPGIDPETFDQQKATKNESTSKKAPSNNAQIMRVPNHGLLYEVMKDGRLDMVVLPIVGKGLWSTMYGFIALGADGQTIRGITYYQQGETPGLGGEVDNPRWKALWPERKAFDEQGAVAITVIKGHAGPPSKDPYHVDGLSGATITSRGVTNMLHFWLSENGFGPYLDRLRKGANAGQ